jgi:RHS repeat-associated protein
MQSPWAGRLLSTSTAYDLTTHPLAVTDPRGHTTTTVYDNAYRVVQVISPAVPDAEHGNVLTNAITATTYDNNGNVLTLTDPRGVVTKTDYDAWNRATQVIRALGTAVAVTNSTTYDANNNILTATLHNGAFGDQTTSYVYDEFDRKRTETVPSADGQPRQTTWTYFQNGTVASATDPKGQLTVNQYDLDNRLTQVQFLASTNGPVTETRTFSYNNVDKPLVITDAAGSTTNTYDALYRLLTETRVNTGADAYTISNSFDQAGNRTRVVYPGTGRVLLSQYDSIGRLSRITDGTNVTAYGYDAHGNRVFLGLPNGQSATNQFDALNRVTNIVNQAGSSNIYSVAYAYDLIGNRLSAIEQLATQGIRTNTYAYDDQYRLAVEDSQLGTNATQRVYTFDAAGNRLSLTNTLNGQASVTVYNYDQLNRLTNMVSDLAATSYAYNRNGSRTNKTVVSAAGTNTVAYSFDVHDRLTAASQDGTPIFAASYDYRTRRVSTTENGATKLFRYDSGECFQELADANLAVEFVRGSGMGGGIGSILYSDRGTNREHFTYNAVGHTMALTDGAGAVTKTDYYEAYGNIVSSTGESANNRLANTKERSVVLGLDNHGFRYYDPEIGRYISEDPLGYADGANLYTYVHNNPINHIDPLGLMAWYDRALNAAADFSAGFGDRISGGLTRVIRQKLDIDAVNYKSGAYKVGDTAGKVHEGAMLATGVYGAGKLLVKEGMKQGGKQLAVQLIKNEAEDQVRNAALQVGEKVAVVAGVDANEARAARILIEQGLNTADQLGAIGGKKQKAQDHAEGGAYRGGPHSATKGPKGDGLESHHMPDRNANPAVSADKGPAIQMDKVDHEATSSWGSSKPATKWKSETADMVANGEYRKAMCREIRDVRRAAHEASGDRTKYNQATQEMLDYARSSGQLPEKKQ